MTILTTTRPRPAGGSIDSAVIVADAVGDARGLAWLKDVGHSAAEEFDRRLTGTDGLLTALSVRRVAEILADAETMARVVDTGEAAAAQESSTARVLEACEDLAADLTTAGVLTGLLQDVPLEDAVTAAGAVGRLSRLASSLAVNDKAYTAAVAHWVAELRADRSVERELSAIRRRLAGLEMRAARMAPAAGQAPSAEASGIAAGIAAEARLAHGPLVAARLARMEEVAVRARTAAMARASAAALADRRQARPGSVVRASWLAEQMARRVVNFGSSVWASPVPSAEMLAWLRGLIHPSLYEPHFEQHHSSWLGIDLFGLRALPPAPEFLAGVDLGNLRPEHVAPLLRRISMTRPAPSADELTPAALEADRGIVSWADRSDEERRWGQPADSGVPLLPERIGIPHVVHGMWLGQPMPATTVFWRNYAVAAHRYAGEVDVVLWVDVPRAACEAALSTPAPVGDGVADPLAEVRTLVTWARDNGIHLINVHEVFHADNPLLAHPQYVLEMAKQLPRGYTAAGDHLRVELIHTFGGLYIDGDIQFHAGRPGGATPGTVQELLDAVATSTTGFTLNVMPPGRGIGNDLFAAPANHPALRLWLECMRVNYFRTHSQIFGGLDQLAVPYAGHPRRGLRYLAPHRTGRLHHTALSLLNLGRDDLVYPADAIGYGSEATWVPKGGREKASTGWLRNERLNDEQVLDKTMRIVTFLIWQLVTREGNLYLTAADPVVSSLPDPDAVWIAILRLLAAHDLARPLVSSVTDLRRDDTCRLERVRLPQQADAFLDRTAAQATWFGHELAEPGEPVWLLDDAVAPAVLRAVPVPVPTW